MGVQESEHEVLQRGFMAREQLRRRDISDERVLRIMEQLPRHHFVPAEHRSEAYQDHPVAIGYGQTISQPYIVALMTDKLRLRAEHVVLEVGTGSGYQTAILARLAQRVYTIERLEPLAQRAQANLAELGISNVTYHVGDGARGWPGLIGAPPEAPRFDRILVAAAAEEAPPALLEQLADGGRMALPLGPEGDQRLMLLHKQGEQIREDFVCYCRFVKLITGRA